MMHGGFMSPMKEDGMVRARSATDGSSRLTYDAAGYQFLSRLDFPVCLAPERTTTGKEETYLFNSDV
jgi:hypothetical protein